MSRVLVDILGLASRLIIPGWIEDLLAERLALLGQDSYLAARYEQDRLEPHFVGSPQTDVIELAFVAEADFAVGCRPCRGEPGALW
jgi:hypothetical protein